MLSSQFWQMRFSTWTLLVLRLVSRCILQPRDGWEWVLFINTHQVSPFRIDQTVFSHTIISHGDRINKLCPPICGLYWRRKWNGWNGLRQIHTNSCLVRVVEQFQFRLLLSQVVALHLAMDKFVRVDDVWLRELIKGGVDLNQECRHPQHGNLGTKRLQLCIRPML